MKVQVNVKTLAGETLPLKLVASAEETAAELKARVLLAEPNPFPEQSLSFKGALLQDAATLADCGVEDGAALEFEAKASEAALAAQLAALLPPQRGVSVEELGLLYSLKHGVTVGLVLQSLGKGQLLLPAFLEQFRDRFALERGQVRAATQALIETPVSQPLKKIPEDSAVQRLSLSVAVTLELPYGISPAEPLELEASASETVAALKDRAAAAAQVPFPGRRLALQGAPLEDDKSLADCNIHETSALSLVIHCTEFALIAQLMVLLRSRGPCSRTELDNLYCCRHGASATQALMLLGWGEKLQEFLERQPQFALQQGCVALARDAPPSPRLAKFEQENRRYLELEASLAGAGREEAALREELAALAMTVSNKVFINVASWATGGGLEKGTAIPGDVGAEIVLFVEGLQLADRDRWLPPLAAAVAATLAQGLASRRDVTGVRAAADGSVRLSTSGALGEVRLLLSPVFGSYAEALEALRGQKPDAARSGGEAAFVAQRTRFVQRQPPAARAVARLLKHWRLQQQWSSDMSRPSDDLLELVAAAAALRRPLDLRGGVEAALAALADFQRLEVAAWPLSTRCYREAEVPKALLKQRPLLLCPTNPLANLADAASVQPQELMERARRGFCL